MKNLLLFIAIALLFTACTRNSIPTKEECLKQGMNLTSANVLNYRTGKYEERFFCKKK